MATSSILTSQNSPTEEDALNCYVYEECKNKVSSSWFDVLFALHPPFQNKNINLHYENFRIKNVSRFNLAIWITLLILYLFGLLVLFTEYHNLWFMRTILILRLLIVFLALFNHYKIFYARVSYDPKSMKKFKKYVNEVTNTSNFIIIAVSLINGTTYVFKSSLGSCFTINPETLKNELQHNDNYYYNCNPSYENGGTPVNSFVLLLVGNILIIITLRCHRAWAVRVNYYMTCLACMVADALSPSPGQSLLIILSALLTIVIYDGVDSNSLMVFKTLLELESAKRQGITELKHFIGNVAHDLKTPLHGFSMCIDHLLLDSQEFIPESANKSDMIHTMEICQTNCFFMTTAINRTVDFAKSASNIALNAKMETTSLFDSIQWAVTCMNSIQTAIPIELTTPSPSICDHIITDKHWLMENMLCYLSNAVKYSSGGTITISISLENPQVFNSKIIQKNSFNDSKTSALGVTKSSRRIENVIDNDDDNEPRMLYIFVEDEGIGISDSKKASLFQPFQQTMRLAGGTGLGLYSLAKRIDVLKGAYGVTARKDGKSGSTFWFSIPYVSDEQYAQPDISPKHSLLKFRVPSNTSMGSVGSGKGTCLDTKQISHDISLDSPTIASHPGIGAEVGRESFGATVVRKEDVEVDIKDDPISALVVEDSLVILKSTKRILTKAGYEVDTAENGAIGFEKMKQKSYTLVVMDLQMPVMDGLEAARRIREYEKMNNIVDDDKKKQFIIGASANSSDEVKTEALNSGMNLFVSKPFSMKYILEFQANGEVTV